MKPFDYGSAILDGFRYLLSSRRDTFIIGQGLWSPWYVGNSMTDLDKEFSKERVIDTPVSESACTGAAVGASLAGMRPIVVHPRMDFMLYAMDAIVNQAAKWSHMFGGQARAPVTVRAIINRGGEQGAQHSQALHSWFAHVPGLRVVMPATVSDARDLLIASVLSDDPVLYIDDRWLYSLSDELPAAQDVSINAVAPLVALGGNDITIVGAGFSTKLALDAAEDLLGCGISAEVVDLRVINPLDTSLVVESVKKTGKLLVVDGGLETCCLAGEVIASVVERAGIDALKSAPGRITLPSSPAPTAKVLEDVYYPTRQKVVEMAKKVISGLN